ncbi:MAG: hypothetical protein KJO22_06480 [Bacteroidia bacterium]|nr:hypothetical protein [Bacteroidia bacterium]
MRYLGLLVVTILLLFSCKSQSSKSMTEDERALGTKVSDTVRMTSDDSEYEIIIIDPGFNIWLQSTARPRGYYTQSFMEARNKLYVQEWNLRVMQPQVYDPNLYELQIDYDRRIDYGYELNYKLYNYFIYFQLKYDQRLTQFVPRI